MKNLKLTILFLLFTTSLFAQSNNTAAVISPAFTDSLNIQIRRIAPKDLNVTKLVYTSTISTEGRLTKPMILQQVGGGNAADNDFVVALKKLIMAAPAWKPAIGTISNKPVEDSVEFSIEIKKRSINIKQISLINSNN
ncbi:hypothetical protein ACVW0P_002830 [Mucilaginibacter sp. UYNi724]